MKEHPILFSAPMVRALLDGSKTQARRIDKYMNLYPPIAQPALGMLAKSKFGEPLLTATWDATNGKFSAAFCPYGQPGDRLWVREAFDFLPAGDPDQPQACEIVYWATGTTEPREAPCDYNPMIYGHEKVRPSIHMPRWASRITLEATSVRVEQLQDISEADALSEGVDMAQPITMPFSNAMPWASVTLKPRSAYEAYAVLWDSINSKRAPWGSNPWVWVIGFKRVTS